MPFDLSHFNDSQRDTEYVTWLIDQQAPQNEALHNRLWDDYHNPLIPSAATTAGVRNENSRPYFLAQDVGLPARITGLQRLGTAAQATEFRRNQIRFGSSTLAGCRMGSAGLKIVPEESDSLR